MRLGALILAAAMVASATTAVAQTVDWAAGQSGGGWFTMSTGLGKLMEERGVGVTVKVITGGATANPVGSSRVDLQACKLEYSIVSPK